MPAKKKARKAAAKKAAPPKKAPECLAMDDAIAAVRKCVKKINPGAGDDIKMNTKISLLFPGDSEQTGCRRVLACIKDNTGFELDPDDICGGTLQGIADAIACDGE